MKSIRVLGPVIICLFALSLTAQANPVLEGKRLGSSQERLSPQSIFDGRVSLVPATPPAPKYPLKQKMNVPVVSGPPLTTNPVVPRSQVVDYGVRMSPDDALIGEFACPASPYTQWFNPQNTTYPNQVFGILVSFDSAGTGRVCTASLVEDNLVLTAGHCIAANGEWYQPIYFFPGFQHGSYINAWEGKWSFAYREWRMDNAPALDYGFVALSPQGGPYPGSVNGLGHLGFTANRNPIGKSWVEYGYPRNLEEGQLLSVVFSGWGHHLEIDYGMMIGVGSNMKEGCSGGAWLLEIDGQPLYANSVNSRSIISGDLACDESLYGPYFNQAAWDLFLFALERQYD